MRNRIVAFVSVIIFAAASVLFTGVPAEAQTYFPNPPYAECMTNASGIKQCWNNWDGDFYLVNYYNYTNGTIANNSFQPVWVGDVSSSGIWPFRDGSGLNTKFNGDPCFQIFVWNDNMGTALDQSGWNGAQSAGQLEIAPAAPVKDFPTWQYFCLVPFEGLNAWIAVWATDQSTLNDPAVYMWLGPSPFNGGLVEDGKPIYMQSTEYAWANYTN